MSRTRDSLTKDLESELHLHMADAHALEKSVVPHLDALIATTADDELRKAFRHHRTETLEQIARLEARLKAHHESPSALKDTSKQLGAFISALRALVREDKPAENAREAFVIEHLEISTYEVLERIALRAGDPETAEVALQNRSEEEAMARIIVVSWDRLVDQMLADKGLLAQSIGP
ncbi:MAG: ferritin-like domain-containing protein [Thermoleophilaceae bacterium]